MQLIKARHTPSGYEVAVVAILVKADDSIIAVYIDPDGEFDEDDFANFNRMHGLSAPTE